MCDAAENQATSYSMPEILNIAGNNCTTNKQCSVGYDDDSSASKRHHQQPRTIQTLNLAALAQTTDSARPNNTYRSQDQKLYAWVGSLLLKSRTLPVMRVYISKTSSTVVSKCDVAS